MLVNLAGDKTVRFAPPFVVIREELGQGLRICEGALAGWMSGKLRAVDAAMAEKVDLDDARKREILDAERVLEGANHFHVLGLEPGATPEQVSFRGPRPAARGALSHGPAASPEPAFSGRRQRFWQAIFKLSRMVTSAAVSLSGAVPNTFTWSSFYPAGPNYTQGAPT